VFREDLLHRLNVIRLRLPALRERKEDVPMLTRHFLQQSARQLGVEPKRISDAALDKLSRFSFPGNVRQLENVCHWLTVMAPAQVVESKDLPPEVIQGVEGTGSMAFAPVNAAAVVAPLVALAPEAASVGERAVGETAPTAATPTAVPLAAGDWESSLQQEALTMLQSGRVDVWDELSRRFERKLILTALDTTRGRRIEAAHKLGIGRNTITRKIQELGLEES
jgi:two-component system nitrogen regulation response regulator GlnG